MIFLSSVEVIDRRSVERAGDNFFVASCQLPGETMKPKLYERVCRAPERPAFFFSCESAFLFRLRVGANQGVERKFPFSRLDSLDLPDAATLHNQVFCYQ